MTSRREFMIMIGAAAMLVASGCATFRRQSDIEAAFADLEALLDAASPADADEVMAIAERMKIQSRTLLETHESFLTTFDGQARDRQVGSDALNATIDDYMADRKAQRDDLLHLQDDLHAALPADAWDSIQEVLNRKTDAIAAGTA